MKKFIISILLIFGLIGSKAAVTDSIGIKTINGIEHVLYLVNAGETIYGISTKYQVSIEDLMRVNPDLEHGLKTGQIISIPYRPVQIKEQEAREKVVYHTVEPGETLFSLSKKYKVSLNDLMKWNGMELQSGQRVVIGKKDGGDIPDVFATGTKPKSSNPNTKKEEVKQKAETKSNVTEDGYELPDPVLGPKTRKRVLIIPFDPYLYFSDADDEIAHNSRLHRTEVRHMFRKRLDALVDPPGYETIHLLGGIFKDSIGEVNRIYKSVTYNYQDILENGREIDEQFNKENEHHKTFREKVNTLRDPVQASKNVFGNKEEDNRYFGVKVKDPHFYDYFNAKYDLDYYVFINQFEVKTNYSHCLDRAAQNYERSFVVHYSIFNRDGDQLTGNRLKVYYESNSNNIQKIIKDNIPKVARQIMNHLPAP